MSLTDYNEKLYKGNMECLISLVSRSTSMKFYHLSSMKFCQGLATSLQFVRLLLSKFSKICWTIFGNLTIILCVSRHKNLQRPSHFFIASLATTDLFLGLTVMVPRLTDEAFGGWYFGYFMCQVSTKFDHTLDKGTSWFYSLNF